MRQLVTRLRESGSRSGIRIVGGAALALRYFDRTSTVELYEEFYAGEVLPDRAIRMVEMILRVGVPDAPPAPPDVDIEPRV